MKHSPTIAAENPVNAAASDQMKGPPRVALVHDHLVQDGGAERVVRTLMKTFPDAPLYTMFYDQAAMGLDFEGKDIRTSGLQRVPKVLSFYRATFPLFHWAFRRFDLSDYDLIISSASGFAKSVRTPPDSLHVCYCHTPTRYLWNDSDRYIRELPHPKWVKMAIRGLRPYLRRLDRRAAKRVDAFIANSHGVAGRIRQCYGREASVIYPPVATKQFSRSDATRDYFLVVARLEPHKRIDVAIAAFNEMKRKLLVVGTGTDAARLQRMAGPTISFAGRISDSNDARLSLRRELSSTPRKKTSA